VIVVVAIMAGVMSYLGARKIMANEAGSPGGQSQSPGPGGSGSPGRSSGPGHTSNPGGTAPGGNTSPPPVDPQDPGTFCPKVTEQAVTDANVTGGLTLLLYVDVAAPADRPTLSTAEAWVCRNKDGLLIYQGHVKSGPFNAANGDSSLLIAEGIRGSVITSGSGYLATNPNPSGPGATTYLVTSGSLVLTKPDGSKTEYPVVRHYP
jgi:hypothetical protein